MPDRPAEREVDRASGVTVCVVVKDRREAMARCLDGVLALRGPQDVPPDVVVVDNGSTDGTRQLLAARAGREPRLRVLDVPGPLGAARNAAARAARTEVVAFTDSDCVPEPGWLRAGLRPLEDPAVGVVQGRTLPAGPAAPWDVTQRIEARSGLFEACNVLYRRAPLLAAGGFEERIGFFGEDTAAGRRVLRAGWREAFAADAVVRHDVTRPGYGWFLRRATGYRNWPHLVAAFPELRDELLWHRLFLRRRSAEATAALLGLVLALARRSPVPALLAAPLLHRHRPRGLGAGALRDSARAVGFDLAVSVALVRGSAAARTVVL